MTLQDVYEMIDEVLHKHEEKLELCVNPNEKAYCEGYMEALQLISSVIEENSAESPLDEEPPR